MECGIVGLGSSGKTTLFCSLTGTPISSLPVGGLKPHLGIAKIPDPRLGTIASNITTKQIVAATIEFVDIAGLSSGAGAAKTNEFLSHVRQVDALCHVVRCFDDGQGVPTPAKDIESLQTELILADLLVAESSLEKAAKLSKRGDSEAKARLAIMEKVLEPLNDGLPIPTLNTWSQADQKLLKSYGMITAKPMLFVANVSEENIKGETNDFKVISELAKSAGSEAVAVCAGLEAELAELDEADRDEMLESMGLTEPAIGPLARAVYRVLGLASFYTAGDKEVRAWTIRCGANAPEAAGAVHSDIQRGFIRAECYSVDDLVELKNEKAIKAAGKMRSEGKNYQVQDGDIVHFLFNV
ncbi:MAG: redox-regulated ATPase YchF [Planctomycetes bacterium]|nr:redox-regulated ATPase YchF [Planctomycetota bacterium]